MSRTDPSPSLLTSHQRKVSISFKATALILGTYAVVILVGLLLNLLGSKITASETFPGSVWIPAFLLAVGLGATALGLGRRLTWGVLLFTVFTIVSLLAKIVRYLPNRPWPGFMGIVIDILPALLLVLLTAYFWRQARAGETRSGWW